MSMCNLIECSDNYLKTPGGLWQYNRDEPSLDNNDNVVDFTVLIIIVSCLSTKKRLTGQTGAAGRKYVKILTIEVFN